LPVTAVNKRNLVIPRTPEPLSKRPKLEETTCSHEVVHLDDEEKAPDDDDDKLSPTEWVSIEVIPERTVILSVLDQAVTLNGGLLSAQSNLLNFLVLKAYTILNSLIRSLHWMLR
jgi:hypothetical protein